MCFDKSDMIKKLSNIFLAALLVSSYSIPQEIDFINSLYFEYVNVKTDVKTQRIDASLPSHKGSKCGLFLINFVKQNMHLFNPQQQKVLSQISGRPDTTQSIVSPSGKFRIHYYLTDDQKPKYVSSLSLQDNLSLIAQAADSVFNFEVNYLGYPPPPTDNGAGGDNRYDIYIVNVGGGLYGYTESEASLGNQRFTSFMVIDNDYAGYYSSGIDGARVTIAHEFHHAIQMGNYVLRFEDTFFYEITSTAMEEFVYDDVNDYYAYMPSYFNNPQRAFPENDGYNLAVWNIFLKDVFGFNILKRQWELMPSQRAMNAIHMSINEFNSSFKHELNKFGIWTHYTKHRAIAGKYFDEASKYPLIKPLSTVNFISPNASVNINSKATANNFIRFINQQNGKNDSLYVLVTNGDVSSVISNVSQLYPFVYNLYDTAVAGAVQIYPNYFSSYSSENPFLWSISEILDSTVKSTDPQRKTDYPYPMPFSYKKYSEDTPIKIPINRNGNESQDVSLNIYSASMDLIYSNSSMPRATDNKYILNWKVKDNQGRKLASGIYFYIIKIGDEIQKGKLVILHD